MLDRFTDPAGGFFDTAVDHETLVVRPKDVQDNATPSGGATATHVLLRLAALTGDGRYRSAAESAIGRRGTAGGALPHARSPGGCRPSSSRRPGIVEIAIVGEPDEPAARELLAIAAAGPDASRVVAMSAAPTSSVVPLLDGRARVGDRPAAYVCRDFACQLPVTDPDALRDQLRERRGAV